MFRGFRVAAAAFCVMIGTNSVGLTGGWAAEKAAADVVIIRNDRGGLVSRRARQISEIIARGQRVEIRGRQCLSSCTMFLGLEGTCITPQTVFGFHGPSYYGTPLSAADFEHWSRVIAAHYPEPLKSWYMREGRARIRGYHRMSGAQLIEMGVSRCHA